MKQVLALLAALLALLLAGPAFSAEPAVSQTVDQVKIDLIKQLERDGYLSTKLADEAKTKYIDLRQLAVPVLASAASASATSSSAATSPSLWDRYFSWTNIFKVAGVVLLLIAFGNTIVKFGLWAAFLIVKVPKELYQSVFLSGTVYMTAWPDMFWASQSFYVALLGAFGNLIVLAWIIESHPKLKAFIKKLFSLRVPPMCVASFWGMLYFAALALTYQSQIFGFFAAVCLSGLFSFSIAYWPGVLMMGFAERALPAVVFGHLVVLSNYVAFKIFGLLPAQTTLFAVGLEYYCTIALGVGFLVGASPFRTGASSLGYFVLFLLVLGAGLMGYFFFDLEVIGSILCVVAVLLILEWVGYVASKTGFIFGSLVAGLSLYGLALVLENYAHLIILKVA